MVNAGAAWSAAFLYALYEILGGSLWITEKGEKYTATELTRRIPDEGSSGEAALASIADFGIDNPGSVPDTADLQGLVDGTPTGQGFENSLRGFEEYFKDEMAGRKEDLKEAELAFEIGIGSDDGWKFFVLTHGCFSQEAASAALFFRESSVTCPELKC